MIDRKLRFVGYVDLAKIPTAKPDFFPTNVTRFFSSYTIFYGEKVASSFQDHLQRGVKAFTVYPNEDRFRRKRFYSIARDKRERERERWKFSNIRMTVVSHRICTSASTRIDLFVDG